MCNTAHFGPWRMPSWKVQDRGHHCSTCEMPFKSKTLTLMLEGRVPKGLFTSQGERCWAADLCANGACVLVQGTFAALTAVCESLCGAALHRAGDANLQGPSEQAKKGGEDEEERNT
eukprot:1087928-Amphidinium_carterae.1